MSKAITLLNQNKRMAVPRNANLRHSGTSIESGDESLMKPQVVNKFLHIEEKGIATLDFKPK